MAFDLNIPWLSPREIRSKAGGFLEQTHPTGAIPVPIEIMVERLGVDIVPLPELQANYDIDGTISSDATALYVDEWVSQHRANRYRFTLAHEIGHVVLHSPLFEYVEASVRSVED